MAGAQDNQTDEDRYQAQLALEGHLLAQMAKRWPLTIFVPDERLTNASDEELATWRAQVGELARRGWTLEQHQDLQRQGWEVRLWPPQAWERRDAPLLTAVQAWHQEARTDG